jgi:hypothetical protein
VDLVVRLGTSEEVKLGSHGPIFLMIALENEGIYDLITKGYQ